MRRRHCFLTTMTIMTASILGGCQGDGKNDAANASVEAKQTTAESQDHAIDIENQVGAAAEDSIPTSAHLQNPLVFSEPEAEQPNGMLPPVPVNQPSLKDAKNKVGQLRPTQGSIKPGRLKLPAAHLKSAQERIADHPPTNLQSRSGSQPLEGTAPKRAPQKLPFSPPIPGVSPPRPLANQAAPAATQFQRNLAMVKEQEGPTKVEVFFATDRQLVDNVAPYEHFKIFLWPVLLLLGAVTMALWAITTKRIMPVAICVIAILAGVSLGYTAMIKWQRIERVDRNDDVRFTHQLSNLKSTDDPLHYGKCSVNIPTDHRVGMIDSPSLQRFEFSENEDKHVILERVTSGPRAEFFDDLNERLDNSNGHTFVFIHGYNVSFENAVKRTAQIAYDLKFAGVPICYSWPSHGGLQDYTRDMANADWTVVHLQNFLSALFQETGAKRIHLIAHSMGNRALMQALERLSFEWAQTPATLNSLTNRTTDVPENSNRTAAREQLPRQFGQIIMAAPDISAHDFKQRYAQSLRQLSSQITLYASSRDRALMVSTSVHGHDRAGLAGEEICIVEGVDTIDVSHIDTSLIGHSYYGDNPAMIDDLRALIQLSHPTSERQWLQQVEMASDEIYWKFR